MVIRAEAKLAGAIVLLISIVADSARANPRIVGNSRDGRCVDALHIADAAFRSSSGSLLWPIAGPSRPATKIVLRQNARDISGGHAIDASMRHILSQSMSSRHITRHGSAALVRHGHWLARRSTTC